MSKLDLFICEECGDVKFSHPRDFFSSEDLFYCFRCCNYTDNYVEVIDDISLSIPRESPGSREFPSGHPLSER